MYLADAYCNSVAFTVLTEWKLVSLTASCSQLLFPFLLCTEALFAKAKSWVFRWAHFFWSQKISSLQLHVTFLIDCWIYVLGPCASRSSVWLFALAERWWCWLRKGGLPMSYIYRGCVKVMKEGAGKYIVTSVWSQQALFTLNSIGWA